MPAALMNPNPTDCYSFIVGDLSRVWSSKYGTYVSVADPAYVTYSTRYMTPSFVTEISCSNWLDGWGIIGPVVLPKYIDREAYRRISTGFVFMGHPIQMRDELVNGIQKNDQINICAQAVLAHAAIAAGAQAGDFNWCADLNPFVWRAADNSFIPLDAFGMVVLSNEAARWKRVNTWAASALKDMSPIPRDFTDNKYWP